MKIRFLSILFLMIPFAYLSQSASFTSNVTVGCLPLVVDFTNTSTNANSYYWDFGNNAFSSLQDPSTVYTQPGFYTVQMIASGSNGYDTIIAVNYIEVLPSPTADFQYSQSGPSCENDNLFDFQNLSSNAISYIWDFGDGNTSTTNNPTYTYTTSGSHVINLIATNSYGCTSNKLLPPITIEANPIITATTDVQNWCDTTHVFVLTAAATNISVSTWNWDLGDGSTISTTSTTTYHQYSIPGNYNLKVSGTTSLGCSDTISVNSIEIFQESLSSISINNLSACQPFDAEFDLQSTAIINSVLWDFGDGSILMGSDSTTHSYLIDGTFNISAQITDTNGCLSNAVLSQPLEVLPAPTAQFSASNTSGCSPLSVQFSSSTNSNNNILWNFGDDTSYLSQSSPSHTYMSNGIYFPQLIVTDSIGCTTTYLVDTINSGAFFADFSSSTQSGCAPLSVDFSSLTVGATNWYWDFGDGQSSTLANPNHVYDSIGIYDVLFITWNNNGCVDTLSSIAYIETFGDVLNLPPNDTIYACSPYVYHPNAQNIGQGNWTWDFGDGNTGQGANPFHTYQDAGVYTVSLTSQSPNGCLYIIYDFAHLVIDGMNIDLSVSISGCDSTSASIINNSTGISNNSWIVNQDTLTTSSLNYNFNSPEPILINYNATSTIGCSYSQYMPIIFDCNDTIFNSDSAIVTFQPPLDTLIDSNSQNPPFVYVNIEYECGPQNVNILSPFTNAQTFYWDFGDGSTSTDQNPNHYYNTSGVFHLTHYAYSSNGDTSTMIINYFIMQQVLIADFTYTENYVCNTSEVNFTSITPGAISWLWDFGSGSSSSNSSAIHAYPLDNTMKIVSLQVTDTMGCSSTKSSTLYFYEPTISFDYDTLVCFGDSISITAQSNFLYSYQWDMGDGNIINNQYAYHVYQNPGTYNVILEVFDNQGCSRSIPLDPIEVLEPISTFTPNTNLSICTGESISFTPDNQSANQYNWSFGSSSSSPTKTFSQSGIYDITLQVTENGCVGETTYFQLVTVNEALVDFTYVQSNACFPIIVNFQDLTPNAISWLWDFGDGSTSTNQNPHHSYSSLPVNDITLTIVDANGCTGSLSMNNFQTLSAGFNVSDTIICNNTSVQFSSTSILANSWSWAFGDGSISNQENPIHSYALPGLYDVTLIIDDGQGCTDTIVEQDLIEVQEVIANFTYTSPTSCPPIISQFNNLSSGATQYEWNFGDSSTSILTSPSHIYTAAGTYNITLIAANDIGCADTMLSNNPIIVPGPLLDFTINNISGCDSLEILIQNNSINAINPYWDFGDGSSSTSINPSHVYTNAGTYMVTLIAEDTMGCESFLTYYQPLEVLNSPTADFIVNNTDFCVPETFNLTNITSNATSYNWNFGQQSSTLQNSSFSIFLPGQQEIQLIAFNQQCSDTVIHTINGHFQPAVSITDPGILCSNEDALQFQVNPLVLINSNITWSGTGIINSNNGLFDPSQINNSTTIYATSSGICASTDSLTITIQEAPDASILTGNIEICEGSNISTLQANNPGGLWIGTQTHPFTGNVSSSSLAPGVYTISYVFNGTCSNSDSIQLTILPQTEVEIIDPGSICSNESALILASSFPGGIWSGNTINPQSGKININNLGPGNFNFYYTISGDCPSSDSIVLEIIEFKDAQITQTGSLCEGSNSIDLLALNNGGIWSGVGITNIHNGVFSSDNLSSGEYIIFYEISGQCGDKDSSLVIINPLPKIDFEIIPSAPCVGTNINILNNSSNQNNETYLWFIDDSLFSTDKEPTFNLELGGYNLSVNVTNQYGCISKAKYGESIVVYDTTPLPSPEIIRSTVINDQDVYTEWAPKQNAVNTIKEYVLFKSSDQINYEYLGTLDAETDNYIDEDVDVYSENYTYYVVSINQCNVPSKASNISSSVLLGYDKPNEFQTLLRWTSYENWKEGVNRYEIQKLNEYGQWEVIKVVNYNVNESLIDP